MTARMINARKQGMKGEIHVPGDKSISHRAVMLGAISTGKTTISGFLSGNDCLHTIECFRSLGVNITREGEHVTIEGKGLNGLRKPLNILDVGNSGTTIRLLLGILATQSFSATLIGDASIAKRPMGRVVKPLRAMGANISSEGTPITICGGKTNGIHYEMPIASAQVKSSILFAGIQSKGTTTVIEPSNTRDHTERMFAAFQIDIEKNGYEVSVKGNQQPVGTSIDIPGDISSAAFFIVAATIIPGSNISIKNVGVNPTRTGIIDVLQNMGAQIEVTNFHVLNGEPRADLHIEYTPNLKGVTIKGDVIPRLIDEIPIIALAATQADGETIIQDAEELKVKETNRIDTVVDQLNKSGAKIKATNDGMVIQGKTKLYHSEASSFGDHRIGMMMAIAGCIAEGGMTLLNEEAIAVSYPSFFEHLLKL